jgi:hypothetical protein
MQVGVVALAGLGRTVVWDARVSRLPHRQQAAGFGPFAPGEAELRLYCDGNGAQLPLQTNTGHCAVAARGNAHLPWVVYETGQDRKGAMFSGSLAQWFAERRTPFDSRTVYRSKHLSPAEFERFLTTIARYFELNEQHKAWSLFHNCAHFSARLWFEATSETLPCRWLPICSPRIMASAIVDQNRKSD